MAFYFFPFSPPTPIHKINIQPTFGGWHPFFCNRLHKHNGCCTSSLGNSRPTSQCSSVRASPLGDL